MISRLAVAGFTTDQLLQVCRNEEWIPEDDEWPLTENQLATFLSEDNWSVLQEELEALPKK